MTVLGKCRKKKKKKEKQETETRNYYKINIAPLCESIANGSLIVNCQKDTVEPNKL